MPKTINAMHEQIAISAFELARKYGLQEALRMSKTYRSHNYPGTMSYAIHHGVCKKLQEFISAGAMYRKIG